MYNQKQNSAHKSKVEEMDVQIRNRRDERILKNKIAGSIGILDNNGNSNEVIMAMEVGFMYILL